MRLIDADLLKKNCKCTGKFEDNFKCVDLIELAKVIDAQPTAYDVEKVEEELLNKRELYRLREIESLRKGEPLNVGVNLAKQASIEDCIEVVRRGGAE